jgi:hypothetical protein
MLPMKREIYFILFILFITGCSKKEVVTSIEETEITSDTEVVSVLKNNDTNEVFTLYVEKEYDLALYEPENGIYLGAYIIDNENNYDIKQFEDLIEINHATYISNMELGDEFPINFVLECIANNKTPNIVLKVNDSYVGNFTEDIHDLSKEFSQFKVPIFIQFMPLESKYNEDIYLKMYKEARNIFKTNANNVAFVWVTNMQNIFDSIRYYPGDEYVDWVGLDVLDDLVDSSKNDYSDNIYSAIDFLYYTFQDRKPIMLTKFGVSHFSTGEYVYKINEARRELTDVYEKIILYYPRIKSVNYVDYNEVTLKQNKDVKQNYSITENTEIAITYKNIALNDIFISEIDMTNTKGENIKGLSKSPFSLYLNGENILISENSLLYNLEFEDVESLEKTMQNSGESYYYLNEVDKILKGEFEINNGSNKIIYRVS